MPNIGYKPMPNLPPDGRFSPPQTLNMFGRSMPVIGWGRHRATYDDGKFVVKVPHNKDGEGANNREYNNYREFVKKFGADGALKSGVRLARCRKLKNGYIVMEKLMNDVPADKGPNWMWQFDGGQVGVDAKGRFKAYDYTDPSNYYW